MEQQMYNILSFFFGLAALWFLFFWLFRELAVDYYRQRMFALRDSLFDAAADGLIPFDHPAYGLLRRTMNGFLRYGHKITMLGILNQFLFLRKELKEYKKQSFEYQWEVLTKDFDAKTMTKLTKYRMEMSMLVVTQALIGSPIIMVLVVTSVCLVVPAIILLALKNQILDFLSKNLGGRLDSMESAALAFGHAR